MLQDGRHLVLKHGAERLVLVLDDAVEEERDVLLSVARLAQVNKILDHLRVADEPRADLVRLAVPNQVPLFKQAVAHLQKVGLIEVMTECILFVEGGKKRRKQGKKQNKPPS